MGAVAEGSPSISGDGTHTGVTSCDSIALAILAASLRSFLDERSAVLASI